MVSGAVVHRLFTLSSLTVLFTFTVLCHGATALEKIMTTTHSFFPPKPFCLKPADGSGYVAFFMNRGNPPNEGFCVTWVAIGFCNDSSSVQAGCQWSVGEMAPSGVTVISGWPCLDSCWAPVTPHSPLACSSSTHAHMFMFRHRQMTKQMYSIHYMEEPNGCTMRNNATVNYAVYEMRDPYW